MSGMQDPHGVDHKLDSVLSVTAVASSCEVFNQQYPDDEWVTEQELNVLRLYYYWSLV